MKLHEIQEEWKKDCIINAQKLSEETVRTISLQSKYLEIYSNAKTRLHALELEQKQLLLKKWLHYNGKMPKEEIEKQNWKYDPLDGLKVLKSDLDRFFDADEDIQRSEARILNQKQIVEVCKEIVESLKWRHQHIRNIIEWKRFESGG